MKPNKYKCILFRIHNYYDFIEIVYAGINYLFKRHVNNTNVATNNAHKN